MNILDEDDKWKHPMGVKISSNCKLMLNQFITNARISLLENLSWSERTGSFLNLKFTIYAFLFYELSIASLLQLQ